MYFPHAQAARSAYYAPTAMSLVIKTEGDPASVAGAVRAIVRQMEPAAPLSRILSMEQIVSGSIASRRFTTLLLGGFAALALLLAGVGIYGVISYTVSQRTFEIGLRMALGAQRGAVLAVTMGDGLRMTMIGIIVGVAVSLAAAQLISTLLIGVHPMDLPTLTGVVLTLTAVALLASYIPARRAMGVDPVEAIRGD
jgi:putative ABC transport system permease protein